MVTADYMINWKIEQVRTWGCLCQIHFKRMIHNCDFASFIYYGFHKQAIPILQLVMWKRFHSDGFSCAGLW